MYKKKAVILEMFLVMALLISCVNIKNNFSWTFLYEAEKVTEIKIVEYKDESYSTVKEINTCYAEDLFSDILSLQFRKYGTNLAHPAGYCFFVLYDTGEYDVISKKEPKHYKVNEQGKIIGYNSWLVCSNTDIFDDLINKYLSKKMP